MESENGIDPNKYRTGPVFMLYEFGFSPCVMQM